MAAPKAHIKVSGSWKEVLKMHVRVSGTWKRVNKAYVRVGGAWKQFLQSISPITAPGDCTATGATSNINSSAQTLTVPAGNSGQFRTLAVVGALDVRVNGISQGAASDGAIFTATNGQPLSFRATGMISGDTFGCDVYDVDTGAFINHCQITRT